jgi:hypothetical protein
LAAAKDLSNHWFYGTISVVFIDAISIVRPGTIPSVNPEIIFMKKAIAFLAPTIIFIIFYELLYRFKSMAVTFLLVASFILFVYYFFAKPFHYYLMPPAFLITLVWVPLSRLLHGSTLRIFEETTSMLAWVLPLTIIALLLAVILDKWDTQTQRELESDEAIQKLLYEIEKPPTNQPGEPMTAPTSAAQLATVLGIVKKMPETPVPPMAGRETAILSLVKVQEQPQVPLQPQTPLQPQAPLQPQISPAQVLFQPQEPLQPQASPLVPTPSTQVPLQPQVPPAHPQVLPKQQLISQPTQPQPQVAPQPQPQMQSQVLQPLSPPSALDDWELPESLTLPVGETKLLEILGVATGERSSFFWKSLDPAIVSVDTRGVITALTSGQATVLAARRDGSPKACSCRITVG